MMNHYKDLPLFHVTIEIGCDRARPIETTLVARGRSELNRQLKELVHEYALDHLTAHAEDYVK